MESFRALKLSCLENCRALNPFKLATGTICLEGLYLHACMHANLYYSKKMKNEIQNGGGASVVHVCLYTTYEHTFDGPVPRLFNLLVSIIEYLSPAQHVTGPKLIILVDFFFNNHGTCQGNLV